MYVLVESYGNSLKKKNVVSRVVKAKVSQTLQSAATVVKKCKGSNNKPPPPFSNDQAIFTFVGSFVMLTILSGISHSLVSNHGKDFLLLMPPFGGKQLDPMDVSLILQFLWTSSTHSLLFLLLRSSCRYCCYHQPFQPNH